MMLLVKWRIFARSWPPGLKSWLLLLLKDTADWKQATLSFQSRLAIIAGHRQMVIMTLKIYYICGVFSLQLFLDKR